MKQNIIHICLDVDDTQYHDSAYNKETGEVIDFKSRPTLKGLLQQLDRMAQHFSGCTIKLCYEASYIGYCLQRDLMANDKFFADNFKRTFMYQLYRKSGPSFN